MSQEQDFLDIVLATEPSHRAASHFQDFEKDTRMLWKPTCDSGFSLLATLSAILAITQEISSHSCPHSLPTCEEIVTS